MENQILESWSYQRYLDYSFLNLKESGFERQTGKMLGKHRVEYARRARTLRGDGFVCYFTFSERPSVAEVRDYFAAVMSQTELPFGAASYSLFVFPVYCASAFDDETKDYVRTFGPGIHHERIFSGIIEHPVLVELKTLQVVQCTRKPILVGRLGAGRPINFVKKTLSFA